MKFRARLSCGVALGALLAGASGALAADFTVQNGQTVTDTQTLSDPGDQGLIEAGGTISAAGLVGVWMDNVDQRVTNNGDIIITGFDAAGFYSLGANASIINNGDFNGSGLSVYGIASSGADAQINNSGGITTSGQEGLGIFSDGVNALISNSGDITTTGLDAYGIRSRGGDAAITNSGGIKTSGSGAHGIWSEAPNAAITNVGDIETSGTLSRGIWSTGADAKIDNGGDITTSGQDGYGIYSQGADAWITNGGDITTSGAAGHGIWSAGAGAEITNSGEITTWGLFGIGIVSQEADAQIDNSGDIFTAGFDAAGVYSVGLNARITNNGEIATSGQFGVGIVSQGANAQINNVSKITTSGSGADGIASSGTGVSITNRGVIAVSGSGAEGIAIARAGASITNHGIIKASGDGGSGLLSIGENTTLTNSGTIISEGANALLLTQQGTALNLLAGSVIQGGIGFGNAHLSATLNIGPGLNTALSFADVPGTINTYGAPMAVQGTLVAVVDPTGFSAQDEMLTDLTRAIAGAVDGRLNAARFGCVPLNSSVTAYVEPEAPATTFGYGTGGTATGANSGFWAAGIGAYRTQDADGPNVGFDTALGGLLVGYDAQVSGGTKVGGFLGASTSRFETDANSQDIDADSYYGGVYAGFTGESYFVDVSVTGGVSQQSSDRTVANNLVEGGIEHATADYDGVFVSPSATVGTTYALASGNSLIPSFRARYAGLFLDSYDESGSAADLSVDSRDVNVFDFRAQLAYALAAKPLDNGTFNAAFRFGADATFADNDNVEAALLGDALNFSVSGDDTLRGFAGVDLIHRTEGGASFAFGAELGYDSGDAFTLDVRGGLQIPL